MQDIFLKWFLFKNILKYFFFIFNTHTPKPSKNFKININLIFLKIKHTLKIENLPDYNKINKLTDLPLSKVTTLQVV
jgi:hypothetical protein